MGRYLAGVASAILLIAGGFFLWTGIAGREIVPLPLAPAGYALSASAASGAPLALPPQATDATREQKRFDRYDRDRNGTVDRDEYLLARHKGFAKLDLNGDGTLSFDEYAAKTETKFAKADADRSGRLDATEFATTALVRKTRPRCPPATAAPPPVAEAADDG